MNNWIVYNSFHQHQELLFKLYKVIIVSTVLFTECCPDLAGAVWAAFNTGENTSPCTGGRRGGGISVILGDIRGYILTQMDKSVVDVFYKCCILSNMVHRIFFMMLSWNTNLSYISLRIIAGFNYSTLSFLYSYTINISPNISGPFQSLIYLVKDFNQPE